MSDAVQIIIFIVPMVTTVALFAFLSIVGFAAQRRREREAYYRHEVELKLAERGELSPDRLSQMRQEEELFRWRRRREAIKLAGLITLALGIGLIVAIPSVPDGPPKLLGAIPGAVGLVMLLYVYAFNSGPSGRAMILVWLLLTCSTAIQAANPTTRPVDELRRLNLESFDQVWTTVRETHWDASLGGIDWDAIRNELRPKVESADSIADARATMREMLARLNHSHFEIHAPDAYDDADPASEGGRDGTAGIHIRVLEGRMIVVKVESDSAAEKLGIRRGWEVLSINSQPLAPQIERISKDFASSTLRESKLAWIAASQLSGRVGQIVSVQSVDEQDKQRDVQITLAQRSGRKFEFGGMPARYVVFESRQLSNRIGYISFNTWLDPVNFVKSIDEAMRRFHDAPGIIIDLRGSRGGMGHLPTYLAGWLIEEPHRDLGTMQLRNQKFRPAIVPQTGAFKGRVAILVDGLTRSAGEIFAAGLQDLGRARVFGSTTAGAVLPSKVTRLPNADSLQYAIANFVTPNGRVLEGTGVEPDVKIVPTRKELVSGKDPVLDAAIGWILTK